MTKPHEEEWKTGEGALSGALYSGAMWIGSFTNPERARLAVQAPTLVRVVLESMELRPDGTMHHRAECSADGMITCDAPRCGSARAALKAAGVIS